MGTTGYPYTDLLAWLQACLATMYLSGGLWTLFQLDFELWIDHPAWLHTSVINMNFSANLGLWLKLAPALLFSSGTLGWALSSPRFLPLHPAGRRCGLVKVKQSK